MIDIAHTLTVEWAGALWELDGDSYDGLRWLDPQIPKPSLEQIERAAILPPRTQRRPAPRAPEGDAPWPIHST